jgi:ribosome-binding factor A
MEYKRSDRVADLIQREIADLVFRRVKDPRITTVTITGVEVTPDLKHARIFYCVMGTPTDEEKKSVADGLDQAKGFMRMELGKRLYMRSVPQLAFQYDSSFEYGEKIERILKELHENE